jgi:hypothetical protein
MDTRPSLCISGGMCNEEGRGKRLLLAVEERGSKNFDGGPERRVIVPPQMLS